ncbi:MAG TPA: rhomboid family intramembrane serine protease [Paludibacter sp.]|nr:rhomboid family intramembrane serine protease [Paludibacter sp.]
MNNFRPSFFSSVPPVVKNLIAINVVLWLSTMLLPDILNRWGYNVDLSDILGMHYWASSKFNPAQFLTYMFMHAGFTHILFNMFALYMFGGILEQLWGTRRFLFYYLLTGVGAGITQQIFWTFEFHGLHTALNEAILANSGSALLPFEEQLSHYFRLSNLALWDAAPLIELKKAFLDLHLTVGASGSVFGLLLAFAWLFPDAKLMLMFFPVPIKARYFVPFYGLVELSMGVAQFSWDNVAHFAHLGGMIFGAILILYWKKKYRTF